MTITRNLLVFTLSALALAACVACNKGEAASSADKGEPQAQAVEKAAPEMAAAEKAVEPAAAAEKVAAPAAVAEEKPAGCGHAAEGSCGAAAAAAPAEGDHAEESGCGAETGGPGPAMEAVRAGETPLGQPIFHAGGDFGEDTPEVAVEALMANPEEWAGKKVKVTGDVSAMCHHRRGWFAVVAGDKSGQQLRVLTMPAFKVPAGSIGRTARAEGTVELIEVPAAHAKHLMEGHKLGDPSEVQGATMKQVVLRASAADFIEVAAR